jgi:hypothetical protein
MTCQPVEQEEYREKHPRLSWATSQPGKPIGNVMPGYARNRRATSWNWRLAYPACHQYRPAAHESGQSRYPGSAVVHQTRDARPDYAGLFPVRCTLAGVARCRERRLRHLDSSGRCADRSIFLQAQVLSCRLFCHHVVFGGSGNHGSLFGVYNPHGYSLLSERGHHLHRGSCRGLRPVDRLPVEITPGSFDVRAAVLPESILPICHRGMNYRNPPDSLAQPVPTRPKPRLSQYLLGLLCHMIQFTVLEQIVSRARKSVESSDRDGELKPYTNAGGQSGRGWRVAGFYASDTADSRLVFEALHYETPAICIIRVYREHPLEVLFARKWAGDILRFEIAAENAATVFRAALPATALPACVDEEGVADMPLSAEDRERLLSVLQPLPPPCNPNGIDDA